MKKKIGYLYSVLIVIMIGLLPMQVHAIEDKIIVIDPGHGGENLGADYPRPDGINFMERDMNLVTALAMKEELEKYVGVKVYLTRESQLEEDISLKDRATFAKEKNADVLISLHFNMSVSNILYGAEVWVPSQGEIYIESASLATEFMKEFDEKGLFQRGVKTRLNDRDGDYYGILRESVSLGLNAILVEHCHLNHVNDHEYYETQDGLRDLGRSDATAVAKYYGLSSDILGVDYSDYAKADISLPSDIVRPDITAPEDCEITILDYNEENGALSFELSGADSDGYLLYYTYSLDDGQTWAPLLGWGDKTNEKVIITDTIEEGETPIVIGKVYNGYDILTDSNKITLPKHEKPEESQVPDEKIVLEVDNIKFETIEKENSKEKVKDLLVICLIILILLFLLLLFIAILKKRKSQYQKNRRSRKNIKSIKNIENVKNIRNEKF